uniref:Lipase_GDSL domain-containing protein n=1 Tax=Angiostrongylus cantonensis TaxID=6313 RepID=A0A0K0DA37_ANGCA
MTGTSIGDLSPEDITVIASMGDALATGLGLWPRTNIEFRGAAFPSGGDATIDGLVTIPNILREFNNHLIGVSHGMGARDQLPETQLSVAESGATTDKMPELAHHLFIIRCRHVCSRCTAPNFTALVEAVDILQMHLPRAFVVLLGPIHVSYPQKLKGNLLKSRCECSREASNALMEKLSSDWKKAFEKLQDHVDSSPFRPATFGILAIPELTITSRYPYGLFIPNKPLLNRRGHNYATKWLWNRLIAGENYNLSAAVLSQDAYFCPSIGCPYFRNTANEHGCQLLSLHEAREKELLLGVDGKVLKKRRRTAERLYTIAICIVGIAFFVVCTLGTVFYQRSKQGHHGRFEIVDEVQKKFEEAQKEEEKSLLLRQTTRGMSMNEAPQRSVRKLTGESE